jgi:ribulose-5-phosphate 4-epimerase/fuculose-1-phosphate aldolase
MKPSHQTVRERVSEEEWALRVELAAAYRVFAMLGWVHLIHTHITVKIPGEHEQFLINPYGYLWHEITASSLVKVDANGEILDNGSTQNAINPAGFKIHSAIHTSTRALNWVMHIHVHEVAAVASLKEGLIRGLSIFSMDIGDISYHDFEHATSAESNVCDRMVDDLGPENNVLLLRNHGSITVGNTVHQAFYLTYQLVEACRIQLLTQSAAECASSYTVVPEQIVDATYRIVQNKYTGEEFGKLEWDAVKRQMEAEQGTAYAD